MYNVKYRRLLTGQGRNVSFRALQAYEMWSYDRTHIQPRR